MEKYEFTNNWFQVSELKRTIGRFVDPYKPINILEIGSYEGASACFFSDNILKHPDSRLTCVDPHCIDDTTAPVTLQTKERFLRNISKSENFSKIKYVCDYSDNFSKNNIDLYDFIYIDGSHLPQDVYNDNINAYKFTKKGGIIWNDDYLGSDQREIKKPIDDFFQEYKDLKIIHIGYQIAFIKT